MSEKSLSIAAIGTSSIMNTIQDAISQVPGLTCKVIYSRDALRGRQFADSVGVPESCSDYSALLKREDIHIIYVASPNGVHVSQVIPALEHGKHVIVEKPAAVTEGDVLRYRDAARANGVYFFEAVTTLFLSNYLACKDNLPRLGAIQNVHISFGRRSSKFDAYLRGENPNIFNPALKGGSLNDMGIYNIHFAVGLFGRPEGIHYNARYGKQGIDLAGRLTLDYPGFACVIDTAKDEDIPLYFRIEGDHGHISGTGEVNRLPNLEIMIDGQPVTADPQPVQNRMIPEMARFRDAILQKDDSFFEMMWRQSAEAARILELACCRPMDKRKQPSLCE